MPDRRHSGSDPDRVRRVAAAELARLSSWPREIADEDAVTFFTLCVTLVTNAAVLWTGLTGYHSPAPIA